MIQVLYIHFQISIKEILNKMCDCLTKVESERKMNCIKNIPYTEYYSRIWRGILFISRHKGRTKLVNCIILSHVLVQEN